MPKKKATAAKTVWLEVKMRIAVLNAGDIWMTVKINASYFLERWGQLHDPYSDKEWKEILLQEVESAVHEKLKVTPQKGELVSLVSRLRRLQTERLRQGR